MEAVTASRLQARATIFKAMAHPTRLFVIEELARGERCVCELQEMIGADLSTVSKHLSVLQSAGLVGAEKRGNQVVHSLRVPCVLDFFACVESVLRNSARDTLKLTDQDAERTWT